MRDRHVERHPVCILRYAPAHSRQVGVPEAQRQREIAGRLLEQPGRHHDAAAVDVGREVQRAERRAATRLEVGRLPDAARVPVSLLALQLEGARRVIDPQREPLLLSLLHVSGQLELERDVAAFVRAEFLAVEPGGGAPVGGADHEEDAPPRPCGRHGDRPGVPGDDGAVRDPRQRAAPGEGHDDLPRRRELAARPAARLSRVRCIELELPGSVEVLPQVPLEVGAGMFGEGGPHPLSPSPVGRGGTQGERRCGNRDRRQRWCLIQCDHRH